MTDPTQTVRLTVAQAIARYVMAQYMEIDGIESRICAKVSDNPNVRAKHAEWEQDRVKQRQGL